MTAEIDFDLAIVGAGPAGSFLAAVAAELGWRILLLEKDRFPRHKVCGEFLSPESQQTLRAAGLYPALAALSPICLHEALLVSTSGHELRIPLPAAAWGISRYVLDWMLAEAAVERNVSLLQQRRVTSISRERRGYRIEVRGSKLKTGSDGLHTAKDNATFKARAVVLASGRNTANRIKSPDSIGGATSRGRRKSAFVGIKVHCRNVSMPKQVELFLFGGGYVGINPVNGGIVNVSLLASYRSFGTTDLTPFGMIDAIRQQNANFDVRMAHAQYVDGSVCSVAPVYTHLPTRPWTSTACVGDVAAMIPPLCGDGMAMALRSAEICAPLVDLYLREKISLAEWEQRYTQQWHREFTSRLWTGRALQSVLNHRWSAELLLWLGNFQPRLAGAVLRATRGPMKVDQLRGRSLR